MNGPDDNMRFAQPRRAFSSATMSVEANTTVMTPRVIGAKWNVDEPSSTSPTSAAAATHRAAGRTLGPSRRSWGVSANAAPANSWYPRVSVP